MQVFYSWHFVLEENHGVVAANRPEKYYYTVTVAAKLILQVDEREERRLSEEYRRQSVMMTSGRAYTISGILSHQVLLSGIISLAR